MNEEKPVKKWIDFRSKDDTQFYSDIKRLEFIRIAENEYGYEILKDKSYQKNSGNLLSIQTPKGTFCHVALAKVSDIGGKKTTLDIILLQKNTLGEYWYRNPNDPKRDSGDLLNFMMNRKLSKTTAEIYNQLREIMNEGPSTRVHFPIVSNIPIKEKPDQPLTDFQFYHGLQPLTSPQYLQARGITLETITNPIFAPRIFNSKEVNTPNGPTTNIAFPYYDEAGIVGVETKNADPVPIEQEKGIVGVEYKNTTAEHSFSGFKRDSEKTIWLSKTNPVFNDKERIDKLIISEAVIDNLSYHQLHKNDLDKRNVIHFSTGGTVTEEQIRMVQRIVDTKEPKEIVLIYDKDVHGHKYDIQIAGSLKSAHGADLTLQKVDIALSTYNRTARVSFSAQSDNPDKLQALAQRIENFYTSRTSEDQLTMTTTKQGAGALLIEVEHRPSMAILAETTAFVLLEKGLSDLITIHKAKNIEYTVCKDWNENLMLQANLKKHEIFQNMEIFKAQNLADPNFPLKKAEFQLQPQNKEAVMENNKHEEQILNKQNDGLQVDVRADQKLGANENKENNLGKEDADFKNNQKDKQQATGEEIKKANELNEKIRRELMNTDDERIPEKKELLKNAALLLEEVKLPESIEKGLEKDIDKIEKQLENNQEQKNIELQQQEKSEKSKQGMKLGNNHPLSGQN